MNVRGTFELEPGTVAVGEHVDVGLVLRNDGDGDVYVFVPHGRADGLRVRVLDGEGARVRGLESEPEPGLVGEKKLGPSETYRHVFPLGDWLTFERPGRFVLECAVELELFDRSLREGSPRNRELLEVTETLELQVREHAAGGSA